MRFHINILRKLQQLPVHEKRLTLATKFTLLRLLCAPVLAYLILKQYWYGAFLVFLIAAVTDVLDGYLARNYAQATKLGAILDPLADKCLMGVIFMALVYTPVAALQLPVWFVSLILVKEFVQIMGAILLFNKSVTLEIKPTVFGKLAMLAQVILVLGLFGAYFLGLDLGSLKNWGIGLVTVSILVAFSDYLYQGCRKCFV